MRTCSSVSGAAVFFFAGFLVTVFFAAGFSAAVAGAFLRVVLFLVVVDSAFFVVFFTGFLAVVSCSVSFSYPV